MHGQVDDGGHDGLGRDEWRRRDDDAEASRLETVSLQGEAVTTDLSGNGKHCDLGKLPAVP